MCSFDCNLSSLKGHLFFHLTLDCLTTNIPLLSTFDDFLRAMQSMPLVFENDFFASDIIFLIYLPISLFSLSLTIRNCQDTLVKHIK